MPPRHEYVFDLKNLNYPSAPGSLSEATWRNPSIADQPILAELMLDAYRGTIDDDGETIDDAIREVESYFSHQDSSWFDCSWLGFKENDLVCASLVGFWKDRASPIIAYVMTASKWKGKHFATIGVLRSLRSLSEKDYTKVYAVITEGNAPSERVFTQISFSRVVPIE